MTITVIVITTLLILYFAACILQWRRLRRADEEALGNPHPPPANR